MGIPGLLKEIGKGERVALAKLAVDHFEKHKRPLRIAIDAAIWDFQQQAGQGGKNPALRTLFYRLLRLLALPIHPVFVYDGKNKPLTKRGKTVSRYGTSISNELSKNLVARFQFPHHTAPGEAEAECAFLQKHGIVDAVMSQDVDAIMFGSTATFRDWSKEGTKGNKAPTHVNVLRSATIKELNRLDTDGMILVALLSGGDYHDGVPGFGPGLSCSIARAGFGKELVELIKSNDDEGLREWRERLQYELETNESGFFAKRHKTVQIPDNFPDPNILGYYLKPAVSKEDDLKKLEARWLQWWNKDIDIQALRDYVAMTFDWLYKGGAAKFIRCLAQPLFQHRLITQRVDSGAYSIESVTDRRQHSVTDGIPELRFAVIPADLVGIDLSAEEENPEFADLGVDGEDEEAELTKQQDRAESEASQPAPDSPSKQRSRPPWSPYVAEKIWIPEVILKNGLPSLLACWEQEQNDIRSDPKRFATRKCPQKPQVLYRLAKQDQNVKQSTLDEVLSVSQFASQPTNVHSAAATKRGSSQRSKKPLERAKSNPIAIVESQRSNISNYFQTVKAQTLENNPTLYQDCEKVEDEVERMAENVLRDSRKGRSRSPLLRSSTLPMDILVGKGFDTQDREAEYTATQRVSVAIEPLSDNEDVVCLGSNKLPPPISTFFRSHAPLKDASHSSINALAERKQSPLPTNVGVAKDSPCSTLAIVVGRKNSRQHQGAASIKGIEEAGLGLTKSDLFETPLPQKLKAEGSRKRFAVSRDSLPGAWKELLVTPSQSSKITFIDLTQM